MGFSNDAPVSGKFINLKKGKLVAQVEGERKEFSSFTGFITELDIVLKEYNGKEYEALVLFLRDPDDGKDYELQMDLSSGYANAFCSISPLIDYKLPVSISAGSETLANGNTYGKLFIRQNGAALKWFYTKEGEHKTPAPKETVLNGKKFLDYTEKLEFFKRLLTQKIRPMILNAVGGADAEKKAAEILTEPKTVKPETKKEKAKSKSATPAGFVPVETGGEFGDLPFD